MDVSGEPSNPDAQATVTDFLDYTEIFPSDLHRSLKLISKLDESYHRDTLRIHELTKQYGTLPTIPKTTRPTPQSLRSEISTTLDHAFKCRVSTLAEADRLCAVADNFYNRLLAITRKLTALPKPPSRDPSAVPEPPSPKIGRGRKVEERTPRITLHVASDRGGRPKHVNRNVIVPGEILPPLDPLSPDVSDVSASESERAPSPVVKQDSVRLRRENVAREKMPRVRTGVVKLPKVSWERPPGLVGTNVHSTVAGISVSNAMALISPPPGDAKPGSKHAPWFELTEWELNKLRKRMKKNALWLPSDTMIRRELAHSGRSRENYKKAKAAADAAGEDLLNERPDNIVSAYLRSEANAAAVEAGKIDNSSNKGMKSNETKKMKKETLKEQEAQQALEIREAGRRITDAAKMVESLLLSPNSASLGGDSIIVHPTRPPKLEASKSGRKRTYGSNIKSTVLPSTENSDRARDDVAPEPAIKKIKLNSGEAATSDELAKTIILKSTTKVPLAPAGPATPSPSKVSSNIMGVLEGASAARSTRASAANSKAATPAPPETKASLEAGGSRLRTPIISLTITNKKAASAEPPSGRVSLRRASNSSLPSSQTLVKPVENTAAGRRGRRPAPGLVTTHEHEGGIKVSVNPRKAKPGRKKSLAGTGPRRASSAAVGDDVDILYAAAVAGAAEDDIDPDEPTWCICGGVSYGTMVACENTKCPMEWFHLECVGLTEIPKRTQRWWCPICRRDKVVDDLGRSINGIKK